ncbi:hypothetical protein SB754_19220, partial [Leifsonia sp. SIMBA_070]
MYEYQQVTGESIPSPDSKEPSPLASGLVNAGGRSEPVAAEAALLAGLIDSIRALEELKAAASAAQARATAIFDAMTRQAQAAAGVKADQLGKGVGAQIGFARR